MEWNIEWATLLKGDKKICIRRWIDDLTLESTKIKESIMDILRIGKNLIHLRELTDIIASFSIISTYIDHESQKYSEEACDSSRFFWLFSGYLGRHRDNSQRGLLYHTQPRIESSLWICTWESHGDITWQKLAFQARWSCQWIRVLVDQNSHLRKTQIRDLHQAPSPWVSRASLLLHDRGMHHGEWRF